MEPPFDYQSYQERQDQLKFMDDKCDLNQIVDDIIASLPSNESPSVPLKNSDTPSTLQKNDSIVSAEIPEIKLIKVQSVKSNNILQPKVLTKTISNTSKESKGNLK